MIAHDLSYSPVDNPSPGKLTVEQIEHYNSEGYILPIDLFSAEEIAVHREYFDSLLRKLHALNDGRDAYTFNCYQTLCEGIYDLCVHPRILDFVEDIVGPNIIAWASHYFCKLPRDGKTVPFHQDASYWQLNPARTVTAWIAIDDADVENAAMQFVPETHRMGLLNWREAQGDVVLSREIADTTGFRDPVHCCLMAGQMSLHADMLVHGSDPNESDRRRCGLTIRYCPPEVQSTNPDWRVDSIIARGVDTTGHWTNNPRPDGNTLYRDDSNIHKPKNIGGN